MSRYIALIVAAGALLTGCPEHTEPNLQVAPPPVVAVRGRAVHRPAPLRPHRPLPLRAPRR